MSALRDWAVRRWGSVRHRSRLALARLERPLRGFLIAAGFPIKKEFLVLRCYVGAEGSGLFSELRVVLGLLAHYERWRGQYAGLRVDYATGGLFYDPAFGENWWEYYFDAIDLGTRDQAVVTEVSPFRHQRLAEEGERLPRARGAELIDRHIRPKPRIRDKVDAYVREHFQGAYVIGIHYRGTNKHEEAPRVPFERVRAAVLDAIKAAGPVRHRLFLATDEQAFLDCMRMKFPDALLFREMFRSVDGRPIDEVNEDDGYRKGEDAVVDCLLLSRCDYLIRTESNLSVCSTLFNPNLPQRQLNQPYE